MRLGGDAPAPPPPRPARAQRLYEVLVEQLGALEQHQAIQLGGALLDRTEWEALEPWQRELFEVVGARLGRG